MEIFTKNSAKCTIFQGTVRHHGGGDTAGGVCEKCGPVEPCTTN
jgi:hypothetical protein